MSGPHVIKYPRIEHLLDTGGSATTDDDVVVADLTAMCQTLGSDPARPIVVEEKIDGANLGFRIVDGVVLAQNRSHYISAADHAQFSMITPWIEEHRPALVELLGSEDLILYGEWCAVRHSMPYRKLPGSYFVAFDLFDIQKQAFYSRPRFHHALRGTGIPVTPTLGVLPTCGDHDAPKKSNTKKSRHKATTSAVQGAHHAPLVRMVLDLLKTASRFRQDDGTLEGVVLRQDDPDWMLHRFKVVRPDFTRGCQEGHWLRRAVEKNVIDYGFGQGYMEECYSFADEWQGCLEDKAFSEKQKRTNGTVVPKQSVQVRLPRCVILMGLPGSGKSFFAQVLATSTARGPMTTAVANQDSLGRRECLCVAGQASAKCRVVIDRCNLSQAERREFWQAMHSPAKSDVVLVHFTVPARLCIQRVQRRLGHAKIPHGVASQSNIVVETTAQRVELPTDDERKLFGRIEAVGSWQDANELLQKWDCL